MLCTLAHSEGASCLEQDELFHELQIMRDIVPHPNIMNLLGYCTQTGTRVQYMLFHSFVFVLY